MKINPTLVGFSGEKGSMLSIVLIKTRNASIPTMKIRQIEYYTVFFLTQKLWPHFIVLRKNDNIFWFSM